MRRRKNPFIVIEALDAGGSQTQTDWLVRRLQREKYQVLTLHFPQEDRATGRLIYDKFLLEKNARHFSRREQALLYIQDFFSRHEDIERHLAGNGRRTVVSDRFCTSTVAYQTIGLRGESQQAMYDWIMKLCFSGTPRLRRPDAVIFIDTPVAVSLRRLQTKQKDFFENKQKLSRIRASYLRVAERQKWQVVDGVDAKGEERTREDLHEEIWQALQPLVH